MDPESLQIDFEWARFTYVYQKHSQSLKVKMANLHLSSCHSCNGFALWVGERLAFPMNVDKTPALVEGDVEEAAAILNLSPLTVETHRYNLMQKLNLHNTAELVLYAVRKKIIS